jgi:spore coat protein JB
MTFNNLAERLAAARKAYEARYGPLVNFGFSDHPPHMAWKWMEEPWPWEIEY